MTLEYESTLEALKAMRELADEVSLTDPRFPKFSSMKDYLDELIEEIEAEGVEEGK